MSRSFGDKWLKEHISSEPDVTVDFIDNDTEFLILAIDCVWKVMSNQEAVDCIRDVEDARSAAKQFIQEALARKGKDDISCIVVRFCLSLLHWSILALKTTLIARCFLCCIKKRIACVFCFLYPSFSSYPAIDNNVEG